VDWLGTYWRSGTRIIRKLMLFAEQQVHLRDQAFIRAHCWVSSAVPPWRLFTEQNPCVVRQLEYATFVTSRCSVLACTDTSHTKHIFDGLRLRYGVIFRASSSGVQTVLQTLLARCEPQRSISAACKRSTAVIPRHGSHVRMWTRREVSRRFEHQFALFSYNQGK
jgi:hypothetical protein